MGLVEVAVIKIYFRNGQVIEKNIESEKEKLQSTVDNIAEIVIAFDKFNKKEIEDVAASMNGLHFGFEDVIAIEVIADNEIFGE